jgi:adenosylmethionine---8-amino-7-oxononanoate aminotransferase
MRGLPSPMDRAQVVALDRKHVWHPYTSIEDQQSRDPLVIVHAEGAWLTDADGSRYLDGNASWWVSTLGHRHPRLVRALTEQLSRLDHCALAGITHPQVSMLAEELSEVAPPGLTRVFFSDDGSTAVETAIKLACQFWQQNGAPERRRFIALAAAFHGDTAGAVSLGGVDAFRSVFGPLLFEVIRAPDPETPGGWERTIAGLEDLIRTSGPEIAGLVVEPLVQGAAGMRMWPAEHLKRLRAATAEVGTWLIADEVFTGLGRTGTMWACEQAQITPDFMCVAKGLSGGMLPFAATLTTDAVYNGFKGGPTRAFMHGHSFCGNPLGAALAREVLAIYREERVIECATNKARIIEDAFRRIGAIPGVTGVRSLGMIGAADVGRGGYRGAVGWKIYEEARRRGAYLRPLGDTVYVTPPLTIETGDLEALTGILEESVRVALSTL